MSLNNPDSKKTYQFYRDQTAPHMGKIIENYLRANRIPKSHLAVKMNRSTSTIFKYFKNPSLQLHIIWEICKVLNYNFLADISEKLPENLKKKSIPDNTELERLRMENEFLKELLKR